MVFLTSVGLAQPWEGKPTDIRAHNISKVTKIVEQGGKRDTEFVITNTLLPSGGIRQVKTTTSGSVTLVFDSLDRLVESQGPEGLIHVTHLSRFSDAGDALYDSTADSVYERLSPKSERWKSIKASQPVTEGTRYFDTQGRDSLTIVRLYDLAKRDSLLKTLETRVKHHPDAHASSRSIRTIAPNGAVLATETWDVDSTLRRATRTVQYGRRTLQGTVVWSLDKTAEQGEWMDTAWDRHFSDDKSRYLWDFSSSKGHTHTEWIYEYHLKDAGGNR